MKKKSKKLSSVFSTSGRTVSKQFDQINGSVSEEKNINRSNSDDFLKNLLQSKNELKFDLQMNRLLKKYCDRKHGEADRMKMVNSKREAYGYDELSL